MNYTELLREKAEEKGNILCVGLDPVLERIPTEGNTEERIEKFYFDILDAVSSKISTVKPNIAFFEQYGFEGLRALKVIIERCKQEGLIVILDAKRGDVEKTSEAYAKAIFDFWGADAVTINVWGGFDTLRSFTSYMKKGKGVYIWQRSSNPSSVDIQDIDAGGKKVFEILTDKIIEWHTDGLGSVVGATYPEELEEISRRFHDSGKAVPLLIPGIGSQGGSTKITGKISGPLWLHRINASSSITYSYEKDNSDYKEASLKEVEKLAKEFEVIRWIKKNL